MYYVCIIYVLYMYYVCTIYALCIIHIFINLNFPVFNQGMSTSGMGDMITVYLSLTYLNC